MSVFWQQIIIGGLVLGSAVYLIIHHIRSRNAEAGCKSCSALKALERKTRQGADNATSV